MYFHILMHNSKLLQDRVVKELEQKNIHHGQARVLVVLLQNSNISQIELSNGLNIKRPTASRMLKQMEETDLIVRTSDPNDDRIIRLKLTENGFEKAVIVKEVWDRINKDLLDWIPEEHHELFNELLVIIRNNLGGKEPYLK
ncbi:MAG: MarR family transcriptional regulator [bacterium]|nr:MarR family transcriptional regulator [bacterium]